MAMSGAPTIPDINAETYPFDFVQQLLDQAAFFNLYASGESGHPIPCGRSPGIKGFMLSDELCRLSILMPPPTVRGGMRACNRLGESIARFDQRWVLIPPDFAARPDVEPQAEVIFAPSERQRFVMLDGLFKITRDFDMQTQPHLLLLQKTMVMVEGVATSLDPEINMWETAAPFIREWIRTELGPEAALADRLITDFRTIARLPDLIRRIEAQYPVPGAAPPPPPLREVEVVRLGGGWRYVVVAVLALALGGAGTAWFHLSL